MENKKLIYVGNYCNQTLFDRLIAHGLPVTQAAQNLETALLTGLTQQTSNLRIISFIPQCDGVDYTPTIIHGCDVEYIYVDKKSIKSILKAISVFWKTIKVEKSGFNVLTYAVNPMSAIPLFILRPFKKIICTTLCTELPQYRRWKTSRKVRIKHWLQQNLNRRFDRYILLTEQMAQAIPVKNKPYMVMEGICSQNPSVAGEVKKENAVMYAGGITEDNGIELLIEGFEQSEFDELWICGSGPCDEYVDQKAKDNPGIKYFGEIPVAEVRKLEKQAKLLVNIRDPENPLTWYSFPSKVLEYMSSGTLVASTLLSGIPQEYYAYIVSIESYSPESVAETLQEIILLDEKRYRAIISEQKDFLKENKVPGPQCSRILDFLEIK